MKADGFNRKTSTGNPPAFNSADVGAGSAQRVLCRRCGKLFTPKPTKLKTIPMTRCCETCQYKNLFDGLDLPTPPDLLDRHTKHPTLTDAEWRRKLHSDEAA
jgi:hypothetical protein